jgi:hypothetical protein
MKVDCLDRRLAALEAIPRPKRDTRLSQLTVEELRHLRSIVVKKEAGIEATPEEMAFCDALKAKYPRLDET